MSIKEMNNEGQRKEIYYQGASGHRKRESKHSSSSLGVLK
jgi:hypothetical protein